MSRQARLEQLLTEHYLPQHLDVQDESAMHAVPKGAQSHFKVVVVSACFAEESRLQRHRRIQTLLGDEFKQGLHALAIHAWTPEEWQSRGRAAPPSPQCRGGSKAQVKAI